jgi:hypothetical protein
MANNVTLPGTGETIATEDVSGVEYQKVKLVDGTAASTTGIPGDATNGLDVDVTRVQGTVTTSSARATTGTQTIVASTVTTNTTLLAADSTRLAVTIFNESTSTLFVLYGAGTESATVYSVQVPAGGYLEVPCIFAALRISGHWTTANGNARITAAT